MLESSRILYILNCRLCCVVDYSAWQRILGETGYRSGRDVSNAISIQVGDEIIDRIRRDSYRLKPLSWRFK